MIHFPNCMQTSCGAGFLITGGPVTWSAGDVWITRDEDGWWLDDDRSATEDQVRELLQRARGKVELHGCGPLRPR